MTGMLLDTPAPLSSLEVDAAWRELTRRGFLAATVTVGLAACAANDNVATTDDAEASVTIEHTFGTTTIKGTPERVLSLGLHDQDFLWALGIQPIAVHEWEGGYPYAAGPWTDGYRTTEPEVLKEWEINLEWVAAQTPDLIVVTYHDVDQAMYDKLSAIAPVVAPPAGYRVWEAPWRVELELIAKALRREDKAREVIAHVEDTIASIRAKYPQFEGKTFNSISPDTNTFTVYSSKEANNQLFESLGFVVPDEQLKKYAKGIYIELSYERVDLIDDLDCAIFFVRPSDAKILTDNPIYPGMRLVKEGRGIYLPDDVITATQMNSPLSIPYFLQAVAPKLAAALDGDPKTNA